jgi:hypothetical protein
MDFKTIAAKKVGGIPVLYVGAAAVTVLAIVAWKMKSTVAADAPASEETPAGETDEGADPGSLVGSFTGNGYEVVSESGGTVTVAPTSPPDEGGAGEATPSAPETNDEWEQAAIKLLIGRGVPGGQAQIAMAKYIDGIALSTEEANWRDAAIAALGAPPERVPYPGTEPNPVPDTPDVPVTKPPVPDVSIPKPPGPSTPVPAKPKTNAEWETAGVAYLISIGHSQSAAAESLYKYLNGLSQSEGSKQLRDKVIAKLGEPPSPFAKNGSVPISAAPAQKQFNLFPGTHTVKNANDDTPYELAKLYYGQNSAEYRRLIVAANAKYSEVDTVNYPAGTRLTIPKWTGVHTYTVKGDKDNSPTEIAAKNGTTAAYIRALNPGVTIPYKAGTKVRVA